MYICCCQFCASRFAPTPRMPSMQAPTWRHKVNLLPPDLLRRLTFYSSRVLLNNSHASLIGSSIRTKCSSLLRLLTRGVPQPHFRTNSNVELDVRNPFVRVLSPTQSVGALPLTYEICVSVYRCGPRTGCGSN